MEVKKEEMLSLPWTSLYWFKSIGDSVPWILEGEKIPDGQRRVIYHCPKCKSLKVRYEASVWTCNKCGFAERLK